MKVKIGFTIEPDLLKEIDELRGITKRSTFIEYVIRLGLKSYKEENPRVLRPMDVLPNSKKEARR